MPSAVLSFAWYWIMAASILPLRRSWGDLHDSPWGSLQGSTHCRVGHSFPGCCCWHAESQALVWTVSQGWIDPSKRLQIETQIMQLCHTVSSKTRIVLGIVWQAYPAKPRWGAAFFSVLAFIPPVKKAISTWTKFCLNHLEMLLWDADSWLLGELLVHFFSLLP